MATYDGDEKVLGVIIFSDSVSGNTDSTVIAYTVPAGMYAEVHTWHIYGAVNTNNFSLVDFFLEITNASDPAAGAGNTHSIYTKSYSNNTLNAQYDSYSNIGNNIYPSQTLILDQGDTLRLRFDATGNPLWSVNYFFGLRVYKHP